MRTVKFLHKWLSVIVALQLLIWLGSGLFFNLMDHSKARGTEYRISPEKTLKIDHGQLKDLSNVLKHTSKPVSSIKLIELLGKPYYLVNYQAGLYKHFYNEHALIQAYSGENVIIDEGMAKELASNTYSGIGKPNEIAKLSPPIDDFPKEQNAVWQVKFSDDINTSVYVDASSGRLVGHSNDDKRFADFFFMLHFMDYGSVGGFNNWQIIFFAFLTLFFCFTGVIWVVELARKGRYRFVIN